MAVTLDDVMSAWSFHWTPLEGCTERNVWSNCWRRDGEVVIGPGEREFSLRIVRGQVSQVMPGEEYLTHENAHEFHTHLSCPVIQARVARMEAREARAQVGKKKARVPLTRENRRLRFKDRFVNETAQVEVPMDEEVSVVQSFTAVALNRWETVCNTCGQSIPFGKRLRWHRWLLLWGRSRKYARTYRHLACKTDMEKVREEVIR